jgi:hypothetical protein
MLKIRLRQMEGLLQRLARSRGGAPATTPRRLQTLQDVIDLLEEQVEAVRRDAGSAPLEKARVVGYLAGLARRAMETGTLAARLEILEQVLQRRRADP